MEMNNYLLIITLKRKREKHRTKESVMINILINKTLNVNGLNAPIKRHRIAEWIRKHDPNICLSLIHI